MTIIVTAQMGSGTIESKIIPIALTPNVNQIIFLRKAKGPKLNKVKYITLPKLAKFKVFNILLTPIYLMCLSVYYRPKYIMGFNHIPYSYFAAIVGFITNKKVIITQTGISSQKYFLKSIFIRQTLKLVFRKASHINCSGTNSLQFWKSHCPKFLNKYKVIHCTIDIEKFNIVKGKPRPIDFAYLGYLDKNKNVKQIIKGFSIFLKESSHHNKKLHIIGDGPLKKELVELTISLGIVGNVIFEGYVHNPEVYLSKSKFFIMASKSEGLPTSMMQAMACGAIPISNFVGNISDLIKDQENGIRLEGTLSKDIANTFIKVKKMKPDELDNIRSKARLTIEQFFSYDIACREWKKLFDNEVS